MTRAALAPLFDLLDHTHGAVDGWVALVAARWAHDQGELAPPLAGDLTLTFRVHRDEELTETVDVVASGLVDHRIREVKGGGIALIDDPEHPVLRQHTDPRQTLYVRARDAGSRSPVSAVLGDVVSAHDETTDDWVGLRDCLNRDVPLAEVLVSFGLFARGPRFLIDVYRDVLVGHGYETSTLDDGPATSWVAGRRQPRNGAVLGLHFGDSFVIAERFAAFLRPTAH